MMTDEGEKAPELCNPTPLRRTDSQFYHDGKTIRRAMKRFIHPPEKRPLTVCFLTEQDLTHELMLLLVEERLARKRPGHVTEIQYVCRRVIIGASVPDHWLVTVDTVEAKKVLLRGLFVGDTPVLARSYDDVMTEDYNLFLKLSSYYNVLEVARDNQPADADGGDASPVHPSRPAGSPERGRARKRRHKKRKQNPAEIISIPT